MYAGGIITLSPPDCASASGAGGFFPAGYCSLVSSNWTYVLDFPGVCARSWQLDNAFPGVSASILSSWYGNGLVCKAPMRSLRIYTNGTNTIPRLQLEIFEIATNTRISIFMVPFFRIQASIRQGYAFPVIPDPRYEYRISNNGGPIPSWWVVVFSDPVFGNRWAPDYITLTVVGQNCNRKLVSSQHDRRWLFTDVNNFLNPSVWGRGACSAKYHADMPSVDCSRSQLPVRAKAGSDCPSLCAAGGGCVNGYCDCGTGRRAGVGLV